MYCGEISLYLRICRPILGKVIFCIFSMSHIVLSTFSDSRYLPRSFLEVETFKTRNDILDSAVDKSNYFLLLLVI